ncbi:putative helicase CHR10, partial [Drosera capensis]
MKYEQRLKAAAKIILDSDSANGEGGGGGHDVDVGGLGVTATLKPHQVEGVSWLVRRYTLGVNVVLGDEMGLGKTLQAIAFLNFLKVRQKSPGPFLVLCPLSVTEGWLSEFEKFSPKLRVLKYTGDKEQRRCLRVAIFQHIDAQLLASDAPLLSFDVLLTTYDIAIIDQDFLSQFSWHYSVIDEAQRLKNPSSVLYMVLKERFIMPRRLLMTGTPIQNNLTELWALMHFCMPSVFGTLDQFLHAFVEVGNPSKVSGAGNCSGRVEQLRVLKCIMKAFMLRRTKAKLIECGSLLLPPLTEITVLVPLIVVGLLPLGWCTYILDVADICFVSPSPKGSMMVPLVALQKKVYMSILRKELPKLLDFAAGTSNVSLQNIVIQLRKTCSHPYLFPGIEPEPYEEGEHLVQASGKLIILDHLLQKLRNSGHRVLLFAQMTHTLDILQDYLELRRYTYERLDGSIRAEERFAAIRSFSRQPAVVNGKAPDDNDDAFVFLISTRAGGVGLNLVAADTVIFYEQDWNPQVDKQALQRAHRIGQLKHVLSISLVTGHTVEEVIMRRAQRKLQLSQNVVGDDAIDVGGNGVSGAESTDLKSVIYGLHMFDSREVSEGRLDEPNILEMNEMADRIIAKREGKKMDSSGGIFEISPNDLSGNDAILDRGATVEGFDSAIDEASYLSWVRKFKGTLQSPENSAEEMENRRTSSKEKLQKLEAARKKAEDKKLAKWQSLGYQSFSMSDPILPVDYDATSDHGEVLYVLGDCTNPSSNCPDEPTIICSCVDDSGTWGHGGMFDALVKLSDRIPEAYERASQFKDLHLGDLHIIQIDDDEVQGMDSPAPKWVALAVVQSYNARRKVPRSDVSIPDLERCISKAAFSAAQHSVCVQSHSVYCGFRLSAPMELLQSTCHELATGMGQTELFGITLNACYGNMPQYMAQGFLYITIDVVNLFQNWAFGGHAAEELKDLGSDFCLCELLGVTVKRLLSIIIRLKCSSALSVKCKTMHASDINSQKHELLYSACFLFNDICNLYSATNGCVTDPLF